MLVFNLTQQPINYRNRSIPADGGSVEFPGLQPPPRDLELQDKKVLSFGSLPGWWKQNKEIEKKRLKLDMEKKAAEKTKADAEAAKAPREPLAAPAPGISEKVVQQVAEEDKKHGKKQQGK